MQMRAYRTIMSIAAWLVMTWGTAQAQQATDVIHTIRQGETVYSIARTYQVTAESILSLNPSAASGIRAGDQLVIPQQRSNATQPVFHTIKAGETLYRLGKNYNVAPDDICKANPGLTASTFKAGMVIRIPQASPAAAQEATPAPTTPQGIAGSRCREMHKVKRKETLYSIARDYGISVEALKAANPETTVAGHELKKGDFLCIPENTPAAQAPTQHTPTNEQILAQTQAKAAPRQHVRMGVILPFKGGSLDNKKMVEFYRGTLMAVDSLKRQGLSVDVYAYDSGKTPADMKNVVEQHPLSEMDLIIGPLYADQIGALNTYCKQHDIRLVVPFSSLGDPVYQNPLYYAVNAPKAFVQAEAARLSLQLFSKEQIILLDCNESTADGKAFFESLKKQGTEYGATFATLHIENDEMQWLKAMNQYKQNVIVPASSDIRLLNKLLPKLKELAAAHPEYRISLVGYPEWQTYTGTLLEDFYRFNTYIYTPFYRNPLSASTSQFEHTYQRTFNETTLTSWPRFGMLGFDIAYFFLKGLSAQGDALEQHVRQVAVTPYQHRLTFERTSNWGGFINTEMQFVHYSPDHQIELIRLKK